MNAVVTLRNEVSPWLMILQVVPDGWDLPDFVPGQYICLGLCGSASRCELAEPETRAPIPDKLIQRAYSIASSPLDREFLEFYLNLVPAGVLTPRLFNLRIGDRIWLSSRVTGSFTFDGVPEDANVVLIANGSGLAPYESMLTTHLSFLRQRRVLDRARQHHRADHGGIARERALALRGPGTARHQPGEPIDLRAHAFGQRAAQRRTALPNWPMTLPRC